MNLKVPISNRGYLEALKIIGHILEKVKFMADEEIEEIFNHYCEEVVNSDEAAAILTLAEVIKEEGRRQAVREQGQVGLPSVKEGHTGEEAG
jgi:hypothetical protein